MCNNFVTGKCRVLASKFHPFPFSLYPFAFLRQPFLMRLAALLFLVLASVVTTLAQSDEEAYSRALQRSLARSRQLYPESAIPGTPLCQAVQARISWLQQHDPGAFSDPEWPMKVATTAASALGLTSPQPPRASTPSVPAPSAPAPAPSAQKRYLAVVTKSFSVVGANFRKNQQIVLESIQDYDKRGITLVDGRPVLIWLDNIQVIRELPAGAVPPSLVKVESARYGFPGKPAISVTSMVQTLATPGPNGNTELLVSDALLPPGAADRLNRSMAPTYGADPATGVITLGLPYKVLTVTYTLNGQKRTKQAFEGQHFTFD